MPHNFAPLHHRFHGSARLGPGRYRLRKFTWRSLLTLFGPLLVLAFYIIICVSFLARPFPFGIVPCIWIDARWSYYIWFILAVFMLEWARAGLRIMEAAALMHRRLDPKTAMQLMWHTDSKWSNPLWWLRAIRAFMRLRFRRRAKLSYSWATVPGFLWVALSTTTLLLFISVPLSGLTLELASVLIYSDQLAIILLEHKQQENSIDN